MVNDWSTTATRIDFDCVKLLGESPDYFTVRIISDRGVLGQFTRHRILSPSVESTRYCNYTKKGMAMCIPYPFLWAPCKSMDEWIWQVTDYWINDPDFDTKYKDNYISENGEILHNGIVEIANLAKLQAYWEMTCGVSELGYNLMSKLGASPQEARTVLPMSLKTEFVMTGTIGAWNHFIKLRDADDADPQIRIFAEKINDIKTNFIKKENK
jgi:thymidylate synthase (FAD)